MARIGASGNGGATTGASGVNGVPPTDIDAIARWNDTTGTTIKNSPGTLVQDGGAIQSNGFITQKNITTLISIPTGYSMIAPELEIELSGSIEINADASLIII